jgi:hypothetical protein
MLNAQIIADYLKKLHRGRSPEVAAYWLEEAASRSELLSQLSVLLAGLPILTASVARGSFDDPNGIIDDLAKLISDHSDWFGDSNRASIIKEQKFSLVLISKRPLGVPQISSPVTLPDWFPLWPSKLLTVKIQSITESVDISVGSPDVPVGPINASLYLLEVALCARFVSVFRRAPAVSAKLCARLGGKKGAADLVGMVAQSEAGRSSGTPEGFRPGGGATSPYLVSHLFRQWWECSHSGLHDLAVDIADALDVHPGSKIEAQYSLASLLTRTAKPKLSETPPGVTFARNALVSLSHAIQFTNAAHHGGDYPNFPALLTISYAQDLARSCRCAADALGLLK